MSLLASRGPQVGGAPFQLSQWELRHCVSSVQPTAGASPRSGGKLGCQTATFIQMEELHSANHYINRMPMSQWGLGKGWHEGEQLGEYECLEVGGRVGLERKGRM